ncbi:hypothetical protein [Sutcliffiella cohnii]|uniref:hypothetical protein n=1 Tax=Sutcliffiella cohnii TaxID=33932 RepID=UPI000A6E82C7|nr:hypothetical protein [Sutcliffiella cohnii]
MFWMYVVALICLYYLIAFSRAVWKDEKKYTGAFLIVFLGGSLVFLPIFLHIR